MTDRIEVLRGLVAKLRDPEECCKRYPLFAGSAYSVRCDVADELEAALAAMGGQGEGRYPCPRGCDCRGRDCPDCANFTDPQQPEAQVGGECFGKATTPPERASYYEPERSGSATTPPPSAVPEGLTARDRCVLRFALHRFMGEAYARHNEASQKTTAGLYASGAAERFYRDAKDAERLLSVFAAAPEPKEGV